MGKRGTTCPVKRKLLSSEDKSQQTVKEVALTEFKSEEIKINEPPEEPSTEKEQPNPTEPISATKSQSSRRDSLESTQSERDSKLAKLNYKSGSKNINPIAIL